MKNWYSYVERFVGVSGNKDGLKILPDGEFLKPWETNVVEEYFSNQVKKYYKDRHVIYGRCAHLTESRPIFIKQGRGLCMSRRVCQRGCTLGGYFNANSTLNSLGIKYRQFNTKTKLGCSFCSIRRITTKSYWC